MQRLSGTFAKLIRPVREELARAIGRRPRLTVASKLPKHGVGAEIGVFKGDFSAQVLRRSRPVRLHLIDPWKQESGPADDDVICRAGQAYGDALHDHVRRRFAAEIERGTVVVHRRLSGEAADTLEPLDWVYIDGMHTYENVKNDLTRYYPLVKPGGIIAGDDYGMGGWWWGDGVREAVDEFASERGLSVEIIDHQFIIAKPASGEA
jgi:hypothetical protein